VKRAACFAATTVLAVMLVSPVWARIGVTSVTDGTTSVVQGADLQTGQSITTGTDGRAHLMFIDGSAVTVGPNSALRIDNYSYDPASKTGAMTLDVRQGTIRFVGGAISKKADVQIRTPSSTVRLRGGIAAIAVNENGETKAHFLHGNVMRVSSQGVTETATRSGSQINVAAGAPPTRPILLGPGQLASVRSLDRPAAGRPVPSVDEGATRSELGRHNSGVALRPAIAANTPATMSLESTQAVQVIQTSHQLAMNHAGAPQLAAPAVAVPVPAALAVQTPPAALPTPIIATAVPKPAPPAVPPRTGGGTQVTGGTLIMIGGTMPMPGTLPPGFTPGIVSVGR
jgi:hypothetical protein